MSRLSDDYTPATGSAGTSPDATATVKGLVQLAGDLGGTAASPTVPGLSTRLVYRGAWAASTAYATNDVVINAGQAYVAPTSFTSGTTFNAANWTALGSGSVAIVDNGNGTVSVTPSTGTGGQRSLGWFDVRDYGAKCDLGNSKQAASSTAGSPNITVTDGSFSSADVGKAFWLNKAGASGADLVSTILTVTDATHIVLAANAGSAVTNKSAVWGTDDTAAYRAAIDACYSQASLAGGASTVFSPGWSYIGGAVNPGAVTGNNAVLCVPSTVGPVVSTTTRPTLVRIKGEGGFNINYGGSVPGYSGSGIFCPTDLTGGNFVVSGGFTATTNQVFQTLLELEDFSIYQPSVPTGGAVDGGSCQGLVLRNFTASMPVPKADGTLATNGTIGVRWPKVQNGAYCRTEGSVLINGYSTGMKIQEHFINSGSVLLDFCTNGLEVFGGFGHGSHLGRMLFQANTHHMITSGTALGHTITADMVDMEPPGTDHFSDSTGVLVGELPFHIGDPTSSSPTVVGCANVKLRSLDIPSGAYTAPAVPASTVAAAKVYKDMSVNVSGGTVTAITVDGQATGLTSGSVYVPAGKTISVTYSVAPTWVWTAR